jgi:molecular chaperone GrpE
LGRPDNEEEVPKIRVTDRRRVYLDDDSRSSATAPEEPSLKPTYVEELEARTKAAENKVQEVQSRFEQLRAQLQRETDETRQRLNRAADERAEQDKARFITSLLPVLDNLVRAFNASSDAVSNESIVEGVRQTIEDFEKTLRATGVEPIEAVGEPFDPQMHEAVDTVEVTPDLDGQVTREYARGYRMGDRLLRPAKVQVGRGSLKAEQARQ